MMENRLKEIYGEVPEEYHQRILDTLQELEENQIEQKPGIRWSKRKGVILVAATVAALGMVAFTAVNQFYNMQVQQEEDVVTYQFEVNYDLVPGDFKINLGYIPEGYCGVGCEDAVSSKIRIADSETQLDTAVSIYEIMTTKNLDEINEEIRLRTVDTVEKLELSGMETHIVTYMDAEKYLIPADIFMFNPTDGYVLRIKWYSCLSKEELIKVLSQLRIERVSDTDFVGKEEVVMEETVPVYEAPQAANIGETILVGYDKKVEFTVNSYEYMDSIAGYPIENFYNYSQVEKRLMQDGTLMPYTRETCCYLPEEDYENSAVEVLEEETMEQVFLKVNLTVKIPEDYAVAGTKSDIDLNASLNYYVEAEDGTEVAYNKNQFYRAIASEYEDFIYMEEPIALSVPEEFTDANERGKRFFWKEMTPGEEITYELIYVVDRDRMEDVPYLRLWEGPDANVRLGAVEK